MYSTKRTLLRPRTALRRRRLRPGLDGFGLAMLELHYYRTPMLDFIAATAARPDILFDVEIDRDSMVLDVGAFIGEWATSIIDRYDPEIYAFEPNPFAYRQLVDAVGDNPKAHPLEIGLGGADLDATMALDGPGASIYATDSEWGTAPVTIRDVVSVLDELGIESIDLLKVNIEGAEYDLFDRLIEADWLPRIRLVSVQFHEWHPHAYARRRRIRRALGRQHTEVWGYPWVWELWQRRP